MGMNRSIPALGREAVEGSCAARLPKERKNCQVAFIFDIHNRYYTYSLKSIAAQEMELRMLGDG